MSERPLISVIVPVYNVEKYINRCVDSIINQTYPFLEIILVDDGSTDHSGNICDSYACEEEHRCIKVIHKMNGGLSDARNIAIEAAKGKYITFVDGDDFVSKYYIENLYVALKKSKADLSISWFENVYEGKQIKSKVTKELQELKAVSAEKCFELMFYQQGVEINACGKLYQRKHFESIRFPKGKLYEDIPIVPQVINKCRKIAVISNVDYYYVQRKCSIQYGQFKPAKLDAVRHMTDLKDFVFKNYPNLSKAVQCRYLSTVCNIFFQIDDLDKYHKEFVLLWNEILKTRSTVLLDKKSPIKQKAAALLSYLGYNVMRFVYYNSQARAKFLVK